MRKSGSAYKVLERNMNNGQAVNIPTTPSRPAAPKATPMHNIDPKIGPAAPQKPQKDAESPVQCIDLTLVAEDNHDRFRHQFRNSNRGIRGRAGRDIFRTRGQAVIQLRKTTRSQETQTDPVVIVEEMGLTQNPPKEPGRDNPTAYNKLKEYIFG